MHVTFRQLSAFSAVARHQSFSRAAEELGLTQPAVSMQVKQLEFQLDMELFEHIGRGVTLTGAGREVQATARAVAQQLDDLEAALNRLKGLGGGSLRISAITTANYFAPRLLGEFHRRYPAVKVSLDVTNREAVLAQLADNEVDMAIMGQPPSGKDLEFGPFMANPLVIVAPPGHQLAKTKKIPLRRMEGEVFLIREPGSGTRDAMERFFKSHKIKLNTGMEMSSIEAIKQSVMAGLGLGLMPRDAAMTEIELGRLVILDVAHFPIQRQWHVANRKGKRLSPAAEAFKRFLLDEAAGIMEG